MKRQASWEAGPCYCMHYGPWQKGKKRERSRETTKENADALSSSTQWGKPFNTGTNKLNRKPAKGEGSGTKGGLDAKKKEER